MCDIIIERIDIKMRQKDETKQAEIMRALYSMRNTGHFPSLEVEEESLWQEVTQLLRTQRVVQRESAYESSDLDFSGLGKVLPQLSDGRRQTKT